MTSGRAISSYDKLIADLQRTELDQQGSQIPDKEIQQACLTAFNLKQSIPVWLAEVKGVSRFSQTEPSQNMNGKQRTPTYLTKDILAGLNGQHIPIYHLIYGEPNRVHIYIGTIGSKKPNSGTTITGETIRASFNSQYPGLELFPEKDFLNGLNHDEQQKIAKQVRDVETELQKNIRPFLNNCQHIGVVTGVPTPNLGEVNYTGTQIDRLIRGLYGTKWAFLVLAEPVPEKLLPATELAVLQEQLRIEQEQGLREWQSNLGQPIAYHYNQMLGLWHQLLENSLYEGGWWVQSYICSPDVATYQRAKGLLKGIFSGDFSRLDRIRVLDCPGAGLKAASFSAIVVERPQPPSGSELASVIHKTFKYHTLVSSGQLSALIHLPRREMPGYYVRESAAFDVSSHVTDSSQSIKLGEILDRGHPTGNAYHVHIPDLTRHALLVGITGGGKTKTAFHLLQQLQQQSTPIHFLVIEPAKREYRKLAKLLPPGRKLQVFTLGEEHAKAAPFRLNPFEIRPGVSVQTHIDLLKSVFNAAFGGWQPLPQVLERAIHEIYRDKGWNPIQSTDDPSANERAAIETSGRLQWHDRAHPTLTDLYHKASELIPKLGYAEEVTGNLQTAIETRVNSLRIGAKGLMLDTQLSIPIEHLLDRPTVLELEGIGDDDEKAFIIGLILISLYEHYRVKGMSAQSGLRHLTIVEEAHRLLSNVGSNTNPEEGNLRGKSVETFVNMLSEIRAYGEGFLIVEQIPTKLAPDVIKNTALKIMHRMVSNDDRQAMGGAMNLNEKQVRQVVALKTGEVVVHSGGTYSDDNAMLVKIPKPKEAISLRDEEIRRTWELFSNQPKLSQIFLSYPTCELHCTVPNPKCVDAKKLTEDPEFEQVFASVVVSLIAMSRSGYENVLAKCLEIFYEPVRRVIYKRLTGGAEKAMEIPCLITHALYHYMDKQGWHYGWTYQDVISLVNLLLPALLAVATDASLISHKEEQNLLEFCRKYGTLCILDFEPFYGCTQACRGSRQGCLCFYRYGVESLFNDSEFEQGYNNAKKSKENYQEFVDCVRRYADRIILGSEQDTQEFRSAALCFLVQKVHADGQLNLDARHNLINEVIDFYDTNLPTSN